MTIQEGSSGQFINVNPDHVGLLKASLRSPSAHNAQPWQIKPLEDNQTYEIHYNQSDDLPEDPDSKDAYLTMGAFVETMVLEAPNYSLDADVTPQLTKAGHDLFIARVAITNYNEGTPVDPLSASIDKRLTNRSSYKSDPLTPKLEQTLVDLDNVLVDPKQLKDIVLDASMNAWANPRYIHDLKQWFRRNNDAKDGITPAPFNLSRTDVIGLEFAFWRGSLKSKILGHIYSSRDVEVFISAPKAAVLSVDEMSPIALFEAGRKLLRSWVEIIAAGYSYQPFSIAVDEKYAAEKVANVAGVKFPVSLYRVGKAAKPPRGYSNRKLLSEVLV